MKRAKSEGYALALYFVALENAELHIERVAHRVKLGGHHIPSDSVRRRYGTAFSNLQKALLVVDEAVLFDNSDAAGMRIVLRLSQGTIVESHYNPSNSLDNRIADCVMGSLGIRLRS